MEGVRFFNGGSRTQSLVISSQSKTARFVDTIHLFEEPRSLQLRGGKIGTRGQGGQGNSIFPPSLPLDCRGGHMNIGVAEPRQPQKLEKLSIPEPDGKRDRAPL